MSKSGRTALIVASAVLLITAVLFVMYYPVIFQRGNPVPYLKAASEINSETAFCEVAVEEADRVFITRETVQREFLSYVEECTGAEFYEQAGSGFIFKKGNDSFVVENEIYLGRYYVWEVPSEAMKQK